MSRLSFISSIIKCNLLFPTQRMSESMPLPAGSTAVKSPVICPRRSACGSALPVSSHQYPEIPDGPYSHQIPGGSCRLPPRIHNRYFLPESLLPGSSGSNQISDRKKVCQISDSGALPLKSVHSAHFLRARFCVPVSEVQAAGKNHPYGSHPHPVPLPVLQPVSSSLPRIFRQWQ